MKRSFGILPDGRETFLYTISCGQITAEVSDYGANLVCLWVPDQDGKLADVVLGYDDCNGYRTGGAFLGAIVGRNANRIKDASFLMDDVRVRLTPNEEHNNLHSGPNVFHTRLWKAERVSDTSVTFYLLSPQGGPRTDAQGHGTGTDPAGPGVQPRRCGKYPHRRSAPGGGYPHGFPDAQGHRPGHRGGL